LAPRATLVRVAGIRWSIQECSQAAKTGVGLDHYQVRGHTGWHRHITLAMLALAVLAILAATTAPPDEPAATAPGLPTPITLTPHEIRRLISALILNPTTPTQPNPALVDLRVPLRGSDHEVIAHPYPGAAHSRSWSTRVAGSGTPPASQPLSP
jgi:hypothetical protein